MSYSCSEFNISIEYIEFCLYTKNTGISYCGNKTFKNYIEEYCNIYGLKNVALTSNNSAYNPYHRNLIKAKKNIRYTNMVIKLGSFQWIEESTYIYSVAYTNEVQGTISISNNRGTSYYKFYGIVYSRGDATTDEINRSDLNQFLNQYQKGVNSNGKALSNTRENSHGKINERLISHIESEEQSIYKQMNPEEAVEKICLILKKNIAGEKNDQKYLDLPYQLNKTEKEGKTKSNIDTSMNVVGSCGNIMNTKSKNVLAIAGAHSSFDTTSDIEFLLILILYFSKDKFRFFLEVTEISDGHIKFLQGFHELQRNIYSENLSVKPEDVHFIIIKICLENVSNERVELNGMIKVLLEQERTASKKVVCNTNCLYPNEINWSMNFLGIKTISNGVSIFEFFEINYKFLRRSWIT
ncbi:hypothetical protein H8356DRAFT_1433337 [Neocallimastix lanati (nom. inval.)]|nr:hypothetical protein H8356DRAFT_1433337 [Neocallimastix sp. JGI-2020a]